mmetsp:Transcript_45489/g.131721  ORF Transcript_45489/g.131721 Transcript_45489/m.131721 type:complete len:276 (+) Transcript_45489:843-1670(+)
MQHWPMAPRSALGGGQPRCRKRRTADRCGCDHGSSGRESLGGGRPGQCGRNWLAFFAGPSPPDQRPRTPDAAHCFPGRRPHCGQPPGAALAPGRRLRPGRHPGLRRGAAGQLRQDSSLHDNAASWRGTNAGVADREPPHEGLRQGLAARQQLRGLLAAPGLPVAAAPHAPRGAALRAAHGGCDADAERRGAPRRALPAPRRTERAGGVVGHIFCLGRVKGFERMLLRVGCRKDGSRSNRCGHDHEEARANLLDERHSRPGFDDARAVCAKLCHGV